MFAGNLLPIIFLLMLMLAGLLLASWAAQLQAEQYQTLSRLAMLDQRRQSMQEVGRALQRMDVEPDVLGLMYGSLIEDLKHMQALDPGRGDLSKHIQEAEAAMRPRSNSATSGSAAVSTEKDLQIAQRHVKTAMLIIADLYRNNKISAGQFETSKIKLQQLAIQVSVNSCFLMAQQAMEQEDSMRAMSFLSRAEILLAGNAVPAHEKLDKLAYIKTERAKVMDSSQVSERLLMMASQS